MIYKYVWQTCQQSLKIISIEQYFVRGNYTFSESCSSRNIHTPTPHPPPPRLTTEDRNSKGRGVQKEVISEELVGCRCLQRFFLTRYPLPATRHPLPVTRYPLPATRHPPPVTRHPPPATRGKVLPIFS